MKVMINGALLLLLSAGSVHAQVYKCTDASGNVGYQEYPCARNEKGKNVDTSDPSRPRPGYSRSELVPGKKNLKSADYMTGSGDRSQEASRLKDLRLLASDRVRAPSPEEAEACLSSYRTNFNDPRSAQIVESVVMKDSVEEYVALDVAARNSAGGVGRTKVFCSLPAARAK